MEKPLATLWRNYTQNNKPDVVMRVRVSPSGLKATTRQHGLTEYWSHRITQCSAPKNYPRVFCWIYRHEGRKLKHELRCHAVLCAKETISDDISKTLKVKHINNFIFFYCISNFNGFIIFVSFSHKQENLSRALSEFKRDKINRQNARLSLVNSVYENPSMPRRKILLSVGANNYRPPLERSKSAPRLMSIEEAIGEEDEENECGAVAKDNDANKVKLIPESRSSCCDIDPLYPAMTLGRRRCRKGHSIRRTGNRSQRKSINDDNIPSCNNEHTSTTSQSNELTNERVAVSRIQSSSSTSSDDDLDKLLVCNNYDTKSPLAGELLSYFDMKFCSKATSLIDLDDENFDTFSSDESHTIVAERKRTTLSLDDLDQYEDEDVFYSQDNILDILAKESKKRTENTEMLTDDNQHNHIMRHNTLLNDVIKPLTNCSLTNNGHQILSLDSDEGSISSGCETASTVTTTNFDENKEELNSIFGDATIMSKPIVVSTIKRNGKSSSAMYKSESRNDDSDSEFSDESGYVEESNNCLKVVSI